LDLPLLLHGSELTLNPEELSWLNHFRRKRSATSTAGSDFLFVAGSSRTDGVLITAIPSTSVSGVGTVTAEVARVSSLPTTAMAGQAGVNVVQFPTASVISASGGNGRLDVGLFNWQSFPSGFLGDGDASDGAVASEQQQPPESELDNYGDATSVSCAEQVHAHGFGAVVQLASCLAQELLTQVQSKRHSAFSSLDALLGRFSQPSSGLARFAESQATVQALSVAFANLKRKAEGEAEVDPLGPLLIRVLLDRIFGLSLDLRNSCWLRQLFRPLCCRMTCLWLSPNHLGVLPVLAKERS
jgi:hypothetical protein